MQNYAVQSYRRQPARTDVITGPSVRADAIYGASGSEFSAPPRVLSVARSRSSNAHLATGEQRVLRTLMFTDIVASTEHAAAVGDDCWRTIIRRYNAATHAVVTQFEGMVLKSLGDGHLVSLRCPTQAIFCARAVRSAAEDMNLKIRVGVHTGECELMDENDDREDEQEGDDVTNQACIQATDNTGENIGHPSLDPMGRRPLSPNL